MKRSLLAGVLAILAFAFLPASALATEDNDDSAVYELEMEAPNFGTSGDGDMISVEGHAMFGWHPKSLAGAGTFTMTDDGITTSGTWTGAELLSFQPYGCGVVAGDPIPPNLCGGKVQARVVLTSGTRQMRAILTVFCVIGDVPGQFFETRNAIEGVAVNVIGVENYSHPAGGDNVYIRVAGSED